MAELDPTALLRPGLLAGRVVAVAGAGDRLGGAVAAACAELGATVARLAAGDEGAAGAAFAQHGQIDTLVADAAGAPVDDADALQRCTEAAWLATRAVATGAMIPGERGGRVVLIAPPAGGGPFAEGARAALENMARTLSIEWSRFGVRTTTVLPGARTTPGEVAALAAFLASPAGDYYSGCAFTLGGAPADLGRSRRNP